jgi:hypothetical protein
MPITREDLSRSALNLLLFMNQRHVYSSRDLFFLSSKCFNPIGNRSEYVEVMYYRYDGSALISYNLLGKGKSIEFAAGPQGLCLNICCMSPVPGYGVNPGQRQDGYGNMLQVKKLSDGDFREVAHELECLVLN